MRQNIKNPQSLRTRSLDDKERNDFARFRCCVPAPISLSTLDGLGIANRAGETQAIPIGLT
jgi:hypothetical protein